MHVRMYKRTRPIVAALVLAVAGLATPAAEAQFCIDFETLPDGSPTQDRQEISNHYGGITFWTTDRNDPDVLTGHPKIGEVGPERTAFLSCWGDDTPDPKLGLGSRFLTDDLIPETTGNLLIVYDPPVTKTGGLVIDTDRRPNGTYEEWTVTARRENGSTIASQVHQAPAGAPNRDCPDQNGPGDGKTLRWVFNVSEPIYSVWLQYTGTAGSVGIAFDSFCPDSIPPTDSPCVDPPPGMVAWWTLDEPEANRTNVEDTVGGHTGFRINAPTPVVGKVDVALEFNGVDEYVEVPHHDDLNLVPPGISIDVLAKLHLGGDNPIYSKPGGGGPGDRGFTFGVSAQGRPYVRVWEQDISFDYEADVVIPDGEWTCLGVSISLAGAFVSVSFYIDGVPAGNVDFFTLGGFWNDEPVTLGREFSQYLGGTLDELTFYDRVLTEDEFRSICDAGSQGKCKCPCGDLDGDGDVDLEDFAKFQACFTGPLP